RLSRRMSEMGLCSRREADEWIENGWVSVDGVVVNTLGARVHPKAKIEIKAAASKHKSESVTILLNKPPGISCLPTEEGPSAAFRLIRRENHWTEDYATFSFKATHLRNLALAGKLDDDAVDMLKHGLALDGIPLKPAQVSWQNEEQLRFVLRENRKQHIQRMCELVGLTVVSIKRIRVGSVSLGKLPVGQWRYLRESERF
ncbi:rRNA pseudouridine synthase, partial [bacterium]|nr:rRNA pseudouridine synthase [bacterium]